MWIENDCSPIRATCFRRSAELFKYGAQACLNRCDLRRQPSRFLQVGLGKLPLAHVHITKSKLVVALRLVRLQFDSSLCHPQGILKVSLPPVGESQPVES